MAAMQRSTINTKIASSASPSGDPDRLYKAIIDAYEEAIEHL